MTPPADPERYKNHRFTGEIISHGVWLYYRFPLTDTCSTRASDRCHTGFSPSSCCACHVRLDGLRESWGCMAGRAMGGAGGCAIRPSPMKPTAN